MSPRISDQEPMVVGYWVFALGEALYAVPADEVKAQIPLPSLGEPQPGPLISNQGMDYQKVDPRALFNIPTPPPFQRQAMLQEAAGRRLALVVDRILGRVDIDRRRFQPIPWHFGGREQLWFAGTLAFDQHRPLILLRSQGLLASYLSEIASSS